MQQNKIIDLMRQGKESWNAWAQGVIGKEEGVLSLTSDCLDVTTSFDGFIFPSKVVLENQIFSKPVSFEGATFHGEVWGKNVCFEEEVSFNKVEFNRAVIFESASFGGITEFRETQFYSDAWFGWAEFADKTRFYDAYFGKTAFFDGAVFDSIVMFDRVKFAENGRAVFDYASFMGIRSGFSEVVFGGEASFKAAHVMQGFELDKTSFKEVPNFVQAHFTEAPIFDVTEIPMDKGSSFAPSYRALRRLARQGLDDKREAEFEKAEKI